MVRFASFSSFGETRFSSHVNFHALAPLRRVPLLGAVSLPGCQSRTSLTSQEETGLNPLGESSGSSRSIEFFFFFVLPPPPRPNNRRCRLARLVLSRSPVFVPLKKKWKNRTFRKTLGVYRYFMRLIFFPRLFFIAFRTSCNNSFRVF